MSQRDYPNNVESWRRACGCMRTSEKLKQIIKKFPEPPPPTPTPSPKPETLAPTVPTPELTCRFLPRTEIQTRCALLSNCPNQPTSGAKTPVVCAQFACVDDKDLKKCTRGGTAWQLIAELVSIVQLSVMATALTLYYLIYCYMQLIYYILRSAVYFHHADRSMKITLIVVTITTVIILTHIILRMERALGYNI